MRIERCNIILVMKLVLLKILNTFTKSNQNRSNMKNLNLNGGGAG